MKALILFVCFLCVCTRCDKLVAPPLDRHTVDERFHHFIFWSEFSLILCKKKKTQSTAVSTSFTAQPIRVLFVVTIARQDDLEKQQKCRCCSRNRTIKTGLYFVSKEQKRLLFLKDGMQDLVQGLSGQIGTFSHDWCRELAISLDGLHAVATMLLCSKGGLRLEEKCCQLL